MRLSVQATDRRMASKMSPLEESFAAIQLDDIKTSDDANWEDITVESRLCNQTG